MANVNSGSEAAKAIMQVRFSNMFAVYGARIIATVVMLCIMALHTMGFAQPAKPLPSASSAIVAKPAVKPQASKPSWAELTPVQQQALKPLAVSWAEISEAQKRKWLELSKNYPALLPADQATLHSRMNEWVALSPRQRAEARLNFAKTKELSTQLTPDEKKAKWQTYQALSPEEKQQLASKATPRPAGAAVAVKPVAPQKLATVVPNASKQDPNAVPNKPSANIAPEQAGATPRTAGEAPPTSLNLAPTR